MSHEPSRTGRSSLVGKSAAKCPICKRPHPPGDEGERYRPFCSRRCADIDLQRWLSGSYAIPACDDDESDDEVWSGGRNKP